VYHAAAGLHALEDAHPRQRMDSRVCNILLSLCFCDAVTFFNPSKYLQDFVALGMDRLSGLIRMVATQ